MFKSKSILKLFFKLIFLQVKISFQEKDKQINQMSKKLERNEKMLANARKELDLKTSEIEELKMNLNSEVAPLTSLTPEQETSDLSTTDQNHICESNVSVEISDQSSKMVAPGPEESGSVLPGEVTQNSGSKITRLELVTVTADSATVIDESVMLELESYNNLSSVGKETVIKDTDDVTKSENNDVTKEDAEMTGNEELDEN